MEKKSGWPLAMKYGLMLAFSHIVISLLGYVISPQNDTDKISAISIVFIIVSVLLSAYILYLAGKLRRDQDYEGYISYGTALGFMMMVAIPASFITSFYEYIYSSYINPELAQKIMDQQLQKMADQQKTDEEIEMAKKVMQFFHNPFIATFTGAIVRACFYLIYSLIASIFVKKELQTID